MSNRITVQSGYELPFDEYGQIPGEADRPTRRVKRKHRPHRQTEGMRRQQSKMSACARKWRGGGKRGSYKAFMKSCLKK